MIQKSAYLAQLVNVANAETKSDNPKKQTPHGSRSQFLPIKIKYKTPAQQKHGQQVQAQINIIHPTPISTRPGA